MPTEAEHLAATRAICGPHCIHPKCICGEPPTLATAALAAAERVREAQAPKAHDFAGDIERTDDMARTLAVVAAAYDWCVSDDGILCGLVAGDMGWTSTSIELAPADISDRLKVDARTAGFIAGQDAAARLVETKYRAVYDHATDTDCDDIAAAIRSLKPPPREFPS